MEQTAVKELVDKMKQTDDKVDLFAYSLGIQDGAKWQQERMYSETEVLQLLLKLIQTESFDNLKEWFEQYKKTCYDPLTERKHTSDIHFECTICGYKKTCYDPLTERKHTSDIHFECTICGYNIY